MASTAIASTPASTRTERYLEAERSLWQHYGLEPHERFLDLDAPAARLRVLEVGSGEPVLFVHGTVGPGGWASLISELPGFRSIVLERPGWGLSSAIDFSGQDYGELVAEVLARGTRRARARVGARRRRIDRQRVGAAPCSATPSRVRRVVLLGAGPIVSEARVPGIIRLIASPAGALMVRMPGNRSRLRSILRQSGHGPSLEDGRIPDEFVDWRVSVETETDSMRHERDMVCAIVKGKSYRPGLTFDDAELAAIRQPTLHVHGTSDETVGSAESWQRVADALPRGELCLVDGAGHMPWFDDPTRVAEEVARFSGRMNGKASSPWTSR